MLARLALLVTPTSAWVSQSQSKFGASIENIQKQMRGVYPLPDGVKLQGELGYLWSYNPEVKWRDSDGDTVFPPDSPQRGGELLHGLTGGITWAWDSNLCDLLLPRFKEGTPVYDKLVDCEGIRAAVVRSFGKWEAASRFIKFVDVTDECEKLGLNYGPPTGDSQPELLQHQGYSGSSYPNHCQDTPCRFHNGCPLAGESPATSMVSRR